MKRMKWWHLCNRTSLSLTLPVNRTSSLMLVNVVFMHTIKQCNIVECPTQTTTQGPVIRLLNVWSIRNRIWVGHASHTRNQRLDATQTYLLDRSLGPTRHRHPALMSSALIRWFNRVASDPIPHDPTVKGLWNWHCKHDIFKRPETAKVLWLRSFCHC